ncbi:IS3 family transposase [Streptomyces niveiscabiei]|uniref:IS3 family transposase n=1 Tax=Streptomyces niveiscabiei TaxID=164115 RepID=UPI00389AEE75
MLIETECIRGRTFPTRAGANLALFEYIDGFSDSRRIQERLGFLSPIEFEEKHLRRVGEGRAAAPVVLRAARLDVRHALLTHCPRLHRPLPCAGRHRQISTRTTPGSHQRVMPGAASSG